MSPSEGELPTVKSLAPGAAPSWLPNVLDAIAGCAIIQLDPLGSIVAWNAGARNLFGFDVEEAVGKHVSLLHVSEPNLRQQLEQLLEEAAFSTTTHHTGWRRAKDGRTLWVDASLNAVRSDDGTLLGFVNVVRDATQQFEVLERQRALIESTAYAVIATTTSGIITVFNRAAERLLGYAAHELIDRHSPAAFHDVEEVVDRATTLSLELGYPVEVGFEAFVAWTRERGLPDERQWTYVRKDGSRIPVLLSITALRDPSGTITGYLGIARDLSELAAVRRELLAQEERLRIVFEANQDATLLVDRQGRVLDANPMSERLSGRRKAELLGKGVSSFIPAAAARINVKEGDSSRQRPIESVQVSCTREDGSSFPGEVTVTPARLGEELVGIVTVRDLSEQKQAQIERDRLLRLVEAASDYVGIADAKGNIVYQNPAANRILGLPEHPDYGKVQTSQFHPPWAAARLMGHALPAAMRDGSYTHETVLLAGDGSEVPVSQLITVHRNATGEVDFTSTIMRDLRSQRKAEALLTKVASQVQGMLYQMEMTADGRVHFPYASPGCHELFNLTPEDLANDASGINTRILEQDLGALGEAVMASAAAQLPLQAEYRVLDASGAVRWHRTQALPERTSSGTMVWHGFTSDITQTRIAEEQLQLRKRELEDAIAALDAGFAMFDADERLVIYNDRYAELFELSEQHRNSHLKYEDLIRDAIERVPRLRSRLPRGVSSEDWIESRLAQFRNPQGESVRRQGNRWIRISDKKTASGGTVCLRADITDIKTAEFEAKLQEERLKLATAAGGIGIWELEISSGELSWDKRTLELYDYADEDFAGTYQAWRTRIHPEDLPSVEENLQCAILHGQDFRATFRVTRPDGSLRHLETRSGSIRGSDNSIERIIGVTLDITEQVEFQEKLQRTAVAAEAASKAKAEFLATMSHEIRTPMNGVIGMTSFLLGTVLDGTQREYVETIRSSGESLLSLINDILDFSKMEAGKLVLESVAFSLEQAVLESLTLFTTQAESKGLALTHRLPEHPARLVGDPTRFRQILLNLVSNALKFTKQGSVHVSVQLKDATPTQTLVELRVKDTGIGMTSEHLTRLGEAFLQADASTTRQFGGTGLGLSICRSLVNLMNGTLTVSSEVGIGTEFTVHIPVTMASAEELPAPATAAKVFTVKLKRVLVAEDNPVNQRVVGLMLKNLSQEVDFASDGRHALELFLQHRYDCILMDGQMPEMDGLEATRKIRALERQEGRRRTPIVALTANALPGDREAFLDAGMDEYLTKPVRSKDLALTLARISGRQD